MQGVIGHNDYAYLTQGKHIALDLHRTYSLSHKNFLLHPTVFKRKKVLVSRECYRVHCILFLYVLMNSRLDIVLVSQKLNFVMFSHNLRMNAECSNLVKIKII